MTVRVNTEEGDIIITTLVEDNGLMLHITTPSHNTIVLDQASARALAFVIIGMTDTRGLDDND